MDTKFTKIETDDTLMETAKHGTNTFPFKIYYENITDFDFNCIDWHWHTELEFVLIESGSVSFNIGEHSFELSAGSGIFINSRVMHRMYSNQDAIIPNFLCLPTFIAPTESIIYTKNIQPIINSSLDYLIFSPDTSWQRDALEIMHQIVQKQPVVTTNDMQWQTANTNELRISGLVQSLWLEICQNLAIAEKDDKQKISDLARLQIMMQYIQEFFSQNITLKDISDAANISKSTALNLFQNILGTSPVNYLISFRIKKAAALLINTEKKISTISEETGFNNVDYFCKTFKKMYSLTPSEYRKGKK